MDRGDRRHGDHDIILAGDRPANSEYVHDNNVPCTIPVVVSTATSEPTNVFTSGVIVMGCQLPTALTRVADGAHEFTPPKRSAFASTATFWRRIQQISAVCDARTRSSVGFWTCPSPFWACFPLHTHASDFGRVDVGNRRGVSSANGPARLLPTLGTHAEALGQQRDEDAGLLRPSPGNASSRRRSSTPEGRRARSPPHRRHRRRRPPGRAPGRACPSSPESDGSRRSLQIGEELVGVHRGDLVRVERPEPLLQRVRTGERPLHRHLLVEQHAEDESARASCSRSLSASSLPVIGMSGSRTSCRRRGRRPLPWHDRGREAVRPPPHSRLRRRSVVSRRRSPGSARSAARKANAARRSSGAHGESATREISPALIGRAPVIASPTATCA